MRKATSRRHQLKNAAQIGSEMPGFIQLHLFHVSPQVVWLPCFKNPFHIKFQVMGGQWMKAPIRGGRHETVKFAAQGGKR